MNFKQPTTPIKIRIAQALELRDMKAIELSEKTGIPKSSISHYLTGKVEPKQNRIFLMASVLNVSEAWLMGYDVEMVRHEYYSLTLNEDEKSLIDLYRSLSDSDKDKVLNIIRVAVGK